MAAQTAIRAQHATLAGAAADAITFSGTGTEVCVTNHDAALFLYYRGDGVVPVAAADETYIIRPGQSKIFPYNGQVQGVIGSGAGTNFYSIELF